MPVAGIGVADGAHAGLAGQAPFAVVGIALAHRTIQSIYYVCECENVVIVRVGKQISDCLQMELSTDHPLPMDCDAVHVFESC
jgi:hypothetical protein